MEKTPPSQGQALLATKPRSFLTSPSLYSQMREGETLDNLGYPQPAIGLPGLWGNFNWILTSPHYYDPEDCDDSLEPPHAVDGDEHGKDGVDTPGCR